MFWDRKSISVNEDDLSYWWMLIILKHQIIHMWHSFMIPLTLDYLLILDFFVV